MSYNIKHGQTNADCTTPPPAAGQPPNPDCNLDIEASIAVIRSYDPDIVAMQEIDRFWARSAYLDEPAVIGDGLGFEHRCYAPNLDHGPDNHSPVPHQYGTVILSRFPILECSNTLLPRVANEEQRGLTKAVINVRGVPLQFFNTHLHTTQAARLLQTDAVAAALDAAPDGPIVLTGDMNARPTAVELAPIQERLRDSWVVAPRPDAINPQGFTSPADLDRNPTSRIDYVFASEDVGFGGTFVPLTDATRLAADHYPVVADLTLPGSAVGVGRVRRGSSPE
ncbi:MAG TPA: endonuclease/exonuclease/phosphatase family protein [Luteitalea sp.]|nr:endonuclease/exonuclease/phosphatase family protein [Luteitalea sp.]